MIRVGVIGGSGYAGSEVLRLAVGHPELTVAWATGESQAGVPIAELYPSLAAAYPNDVFVAFEDRLLDGVDAVVLALPHGASQQVVPHLVDRVRWIVDLGSDFRLTDASLYEEWYGAPHTAPELLGSFVYGIPELYRDQIAGATRVAAPGCFPTAAILPLVPLVRAGVIETDRVVVDAVTGVSGAGRPPKPSTTFCTVDEDVRAYGLLTHRHTPEMEIHIGASILFTPHLVPMSRGILTTSYAPATDAVRSDGDLLGILADAYAGEPFVVVSEASPSTKATQGANTAHLSARYDARTQTVIMLCALDNLVKGTAGQAIQCLNLMAGLPEDCGLPRVGLTP